MKDSPCRDTGNPAQSYSDSDGTPNDMGADGGPWGTQDAVAPQINDLAITPNVVKKGGTICFLADACDEWGIAGYSWDFDDTDGIQEDGRGKEISHLFEDEGIYTVTLTVEDNNGLTTSHTGNIHITPQEPPQIVSITALPPCGNVPLKVFFTVNAQDPDGYIVSYQWDFNDDGIYQVCRAGPDILFTFKDLKDNRSELRKISVCATDDDGLKTCCTKSITIAPLDHEIVASTTIGKEGGELEVDKPLSDLAGAKIIIPPHALTENTAITISKVDQCPLFPDQVQEIGCPLEFGPSIDFQSSVTIMIPYDDQKLDKHKHKDMREENLTIFFYNSAISQWAPLEETDIDYENQNISGKVYHFSLFTIGYPKNEEGQTGETIVAKNNGCFLSDLSNFFIHP